MKEKRYRAIGVRNRPLWTAIGIVESYLVPVQGSDCMIRKTLDTAEGFADTLTYEVEDRKAVQKVMEREVVEGKYTKEFFDALDKTYKDTVRDIKEFSKSDFVHASVEELVGYFDRFYKIYITTLHPMVLAIYASDLQELFETELRRVVGDVPREKVLEYTALLLTPTRLSTVQKEEQVLFSIQSQFQRDCPGQSKEEYDRFIGSADVHSRLEKLAEDYGWFHMEYIGEPKLAGDYAELLWQRIDDLKRSEVEWKDQTSPEERLADIISRQKEFFDAHPDSELLKRVVFAMQEFLIVLDYTKADLIEGIYCARPLITELAKRVGLGDWISVRYLLPDELKELLRNSKTTDHSYIRERRQHYAFLLEDGAITMYFGDEAARITDELLERESTEGIREFKGLTAYPGVVRGIATIVTGAQDRDKFERGHIMVTRDTTTELTSIIKKASAIIADNGSLLSHTAIVSREFKIPCLVLTQIGTKVVKDGDELEVDATNGTVRILD